MENCGGRKPCLPHLFLAERGDRCETTESLAVELAEGAEVPAVGHLYLETAGHRRPENDDVLHPAHRTRVPHLHRGPVGVTTPVPPHLHPVAVVQ